MNPRRSFVTLFNLLYIFVRIVWPPFQIYYLRTDAAGRTILALTIIVVLLNINELQRYKKAFATPAFRCWMALLCYSMLNSLVKGFYSENGALKFFSVNYILPIVFLAIAMLELYKDKQRGLKAIWLALLVYFILGLPFMGRNLDERSVVEGLGNLFPLHAVALLFVSAVRLVEGRLKTRLFIVLAFFITIAILISGTRKAFGAEIIILLGVILNNRRQKDVWFYFKIILLGIVMLTFIRYSLSHSTVGQRTEEEFDKDRKAQLVENRYVNNILVKLLGDRAIQYEMGLELFHRHVLTGIGLTNFKVVARFDMRLHSEYMVQLCENGLIGFILLVLYYVRIWKALKKAKKRTTPKVINMVSYGLFVILFLNFTAWTYNQNCVMIIYAIIHIYTNHHLNTQTYLSSN